MKTYCTYLTIYSGDKLPQFYIGSSTIERIYEHNYLGSVSSKKYKEIWKQELINNRHLFDIVILSEHSSQREAIIQERKYHILQDVIRNQNFVNMSFAQVDGSFGHSAIVIQIANNKHPAKGLKWVTNGIDHKKAKGKKLKQLLNEGWVLGRTVSIKTREKLRNVGLGKPSPIKGSKRDYYNITKTELITCPHCGFEGIKNMSRWHFDNCKTITNRVNLSDKSEPCPHCNKSGSGINKIYHFNNCKMRLL